MLARYSSFAASRTQAPINIGTVIIPLVLVLRIWSRMLSGVGVIGVDVCVVAVGGYMALITSEYIG